MRWTNGRYPPRSCENYTASTQPRRCPFAGQRPVRGQAVRKRARSKNVQNCFLYGLLPMAVAGVIGFQIDEIEKDFLRANRTSEFSHSLGHEDPLPPRRLNVRYRF